MRIPGPRIFFHAAKRFFFFLFFFSIAAFKNTSVRDFHINEEMSNDGCVCPETRTHKHMYTSVYTQLVCGNPHLVK